MDEAEYFRRTFYAFAVVLMLISALQVGVAVLGVMTIDRGWARGERVVEQTWKAVWLLFGSVVAALVVLLVALALGHVHRHYL